VLDPALSEQGSVRLQDLRVCALVRRFAQRAITGLGAEMRQGLGILELALPVLSERDRFCAGAGRQKNGAPARLRPANGSPGQAFRIAQLSGRFLGSIENREYPKFSPKRLVATPKVIARSRMANSLQKLATWAPESVFYSTTASFTESTMSGSGDRYTETMADTKIALAPRGSSVETYRFFEAMRQGCVVICDRLPPHWFYVGCPAIQIDDWGNLETEVKALSADPERLADLHCRSLAWWDEKLSENAVAQVMAKCLEAPRGQKRPK
jgi:hypothetical protein